MRFIVDSSKLKKPNEFLEQVIREFFDENHII